MKRLSISILFLLLTVNVAFAEITAPVTTYGIHLYFDEQEFVDILVINKDADGVLTGDMHVPNDFDGKVSNLVVNDEKIVFDLLVPKNSSRPTDLMFHYEGKFFDKSLNQMIGFVSIKGESGFVASFVGFIRD
ncbi:hypothetical protein SHI21_08505 [Bacteriovorax sp. PP10]|uniref:Uncharacterized protein n=1 Tax=Bacteriovorax antarcticus TaxID=3088717 RepID=A0ABU5VW41_9BACT|nr:hypothetical protein [Bacteriovorax sp. PP10]MEA9356240.1 hypothetical protein [Bacteriovorax sp. PP10]